MTYLFVNVIYRTQWPSTYVDQVWWWYVIQSFRIRFVVSMTSFKMHVEPHEIKVYRQTSNISRTLLGHKIVDHLDVVGASPVGAAPTTSSCST